MKKKDGKIRRVEEEVKRKSASNEGGVEGQ